MITAGNANKLHKTKAYSSANRLLNSVCHKKTEPASQAKQVAQTNNDAQNNNNSDIKHELHSVPLS